MRQCRGSYDDTCECPRCQKNRQKKSRFAETACYARIGDKVTVSMQLPSPQTWVATLNTPESAAMANELINDPDSGFKLLSAQQV